jgi:hypothetical protein
MYVGIGFLSLRDYTLWIAPAQSPSARPDVSRNSVGIAQDGHQLRGNAALLHHRGYGRRVALNIFSIAGDVRYRQQRDELVDDGAFVLVPPGARGLRRGFDCVMTGADTSTTASDNSAWYRFMRASSTERRSHPASL